MPCVKLPAIPDIPLPSFGLKPPAIPLPTLPDGICCKLPPIPTPDLPIPPALAVIIPPEVLTAMREARKTILEFLDAIPLKCPKE